MEWWEELHAILDAKIKKNNLLTIEATLFDEYYDRKNIAKDIAAIKIGGIAEGTDITLEEAKSIQAALVANPEAVDELLQKNHPDITATTAPNIYDVEASKEQQQKIANIFAQYYEECPKNLPKDNNQWVVIHTIKAGKNTDVINELKKLELTTRLNLVYNTDREYLGGKMSNDIDTHNTLASIGIKPSGKIQAILSSAADGNEIWVYQSDTCAAEMIAQALTMQYSRYTAKKRATRHKYAMGSNLREVREEYTVPSMVSNAYINDRLLIIAQDKNQAPEAILVDQLNQRGIDIVDNDIEYYIKSANVETYGMLCRYCQDNGTNNDNFISFNELAKYNGKLEDILKKYNGTLPNEYAKRMYKNLRLFSALKTVHLEWYDQKRQERYEIDIDTFKFTLVTSKDGYSKRGIKGLRITPEFEQLAKKQLAKPYPKSLDRLSPKARIIAELIISVGMGKFPTVSENNVFFKIGTIEEIAKKIYGKAKSRQQDYNNRKMIPKHLEEILQTCPDVLEDYDIRGNEIWVKVAAELWSKTLITPTERATIKAKAASVAASKKADLEQLIDYYKQEDGLTRTTTRVLERAAKELEITKEELEGYRNKPETIPDEIAERVKAQVDGITIRKNRL